MPSRRVVLSRNEINSKPFTNIGEPIHVKEWLNEMWIVLYTYGNSLEMVLVLVSNLSFVAFLSSLNGFIYRRGCPDNIVSGNASNFQSKI